MSRYSWIVGLVSILLSPISLSQSPLFAVAGSNTVGAELGPACAAAYLISHKGAKNTSTVKTGVDNEFFVVADNNNAIQFAAHGSSTGFKALLNNSAQVAMASRRIKSKEVNALSFKGDMTNILAEHTIAIDGLAVIVNPNNPVTRLSKQQIADIFSGAIINWAEVSGVNAAIHIYARDENSGTWDTFKSLVLGDLQLRSDAQRFESNQILSNSVAMDPLSIGFTSIAAINRNTALAIADDTTTAYMRPTRLTVASEDYLLARRLFMYVAPTETNTDARQFVEFCLSEQGQQIVETIGFIPQNVIPLDSSVADAAPPEYRQLAERGQRLSVNFRFDAASAELDNKAKRDIGRLTQFYKTLGADKSLVLVGFSDAKARASTATLLSKMRALEVKNALRENGVKVDQLLSLGADIPVAANSREDSTHKNGRVEVWLLNG